MSEREVPMDQDQETPLAQRQTQTWKEAVPHNHEHPEVFSRDCLRCQDAARTKNAGELRALYAAIQDARAALERVDADV